MTYREATLSGGGEMGALMRALDWTRSPLGPPERWPQSLRTSVSTCLNSRFPILVWWGPELAMLYNDAYRPMLGDKHPASMGAPGATYWHEIWHIIGPMLRGVLERGEASWSEDTMLPINRHGFVEETYFTFSYSPIRDESGNVGGVFTAVQETTGTVLNERRLETLRSLAAATADAESVSAVCSQVGRTLDERRTDVPFARLYLVDESGEAARLAAHSGLDPSVTSSPATLTLEGTDPWSVAKVIRTGSAVELPGTVRHHVGALDGNDAPALVLPLFDRGTGRTIGALLAATSPHLILDEPYRNFLSLVAGQVSTALGGARALEAAQQRAEALAELDRAKTQFFSNVSHEFRTPLTLMLGPAQDLMKSRALSEGERRDTEILHRNALRLLRLVNTLLDFSRIEAGRAQVRFEPTDLATFTAELASVFRSAAERAGLSLEVDCAPLDRPVNVDREMWEKIVLNLLSNAFKHTMEGTIRVSLRADGTDVVLEVKDTGAGIPAQELPRIFDRFHRVEGSLARSQEGSGIGLALVRELVGLHHGTVEARSVVGRGSTFVVRMPRGRADLSSSTEARPIAAGPFVQEAMSWLPSRTDEPVPAAAAGRVLFADDNADMREYVGRLLRDAGWNVELVGNGIDALQSALARPPDLVLSDVMMPRLDGFGLLRELRSHEETRGVPFLMLSARAGEEARIEGLGAGADDYLVKPFSARALVTRVGTLVAAGRSRLATERLAAAEREARALAERADRRKDEFLAMLAHELRNPLAAISNALILLGRPNVDPAKQQQLRETCTRQVAHLVRLVDDLLDVSRITRGKVELRKEPVELGALIRHAVQSARPLLDARQHHLTVRLAPGPVRLHADPTRLEQVVVNLLSNAAKYTAPGGSIVLELDRVEDACVLRVTDDGRGIPKEMLPFVFEPFVQVDPALDRSAGGLGIGLTLVQRLAELHGGSASAHSDGPGKGARFEVRLPVDETQPVAAQVVAESPRKAGRRVVVVEDSEDVRETLQSLIEDLGHEVAVAKDGLEGVERVLAVQPEIALVDVGLPGIDGYELARRVRASPVGASVRLIALTGYGGAEAAARAREAGFDMHLVKPIRLAQLDEIFEPEGAAASA